MFKRIIYSGVPAICLHACFDRLSKRRFYKQISCLSLRRELSRTLSKATIKIFQSYYFYSLLFTLLINTHILFAQKFQGGILAGLSTSQVDGDHLSGFNKAGFKGGGMVYRKLSGKTALQFEIEFIQKGSRKPLNNDNQYYLMRLNYIEVPLMFSYYVGKKWSLEAGLAYATLLSSYEEDETGEIKNAPEFHKSDYLVCIGGNYFITPHFLFNVRYSYSMTTIRPKNENYNYFYFVGGQYNKVLAFSLAYLF